MNVFQNNNIFNLLGANQICDKILAMAPIGKTTSIALGGTAAIALQNRKQNQNASNIIFECFDFSTYYTIAKRLPELQVQQLKKFENYITFEYKVNNINLCFVILNTKKSKRTLQVNNITVVEQSQIQIK